MATSLADFALLIAAEDAVQVDVQALVQVDLQLQASRRGQILSSSAPMAWGHALAPATSSRPAAPSASISMPASRHGSATPQKRLRNMNHNF
jgi:hypothetical protein